MATRAYLLNTTDTVGSAGLSPSRSLIYWLCDLEGDRPTAALCLEGDLAYTKDTDKLYRNAGSSWLEVGGGGGSPPTGTGFRHVTVGVEDAAAKLVDTADISDNQVTYAKFQDITATDRFLGRKTAGAGDIEELTGTEVTARLDTFTTTLKGLVVASGGGTTNFLRADGTWTAPTGGSVPDANTFYALYDRITPAANKYMATLFNTSATRKVVVHKIWWINASITAVTGVILDQYLARITARTAGTSVTIRTNDTADTLSAGITADTNSTSVTEDHISERFIATSEEPTIAQTQLTAYSQSGGLIYERTPGTRGVTLRQNQGISLRNITNSTVGQVSYCFEFTDEAA